jgi:hypothetical protein
MDGQAGNRKRKKSLVQELALWFWNEILDGGTVVVPGLTEPIDFWKAEPRYRNRYLGEAKTAIKKHELDVQVLKVALRRLKAQGRHPKDLFMPCRWRSGGDIYYDTILREKDTPPPVYNRIALREWATTWERDDVIKDFDL